MDHDLGNGWTAKKVGKLYEVYHHGVFKFSAVRLKCAKQRAK